MAKLMFCVLNYKIPKFPLYASCNLQLVSIFCNFRWRYALVVNIRLRLTNWRTSKDQSQSSSKHDENVQRNSQRKSRRRHSTGWRRFYQANDRRPSPQGYGSVCGQFEGEVQQAINYLYHDDKVNNFVYPADFKVLFAICKVLSYFASKTKYFVM